MNENFNRSDIRKGFIGKKGNWLSALGGGNWVPILKLFTTSALVARLGWDQTLLDFPQGYFHCPTFHHNPRKLREGEGSATFSTPGSESSQFICWQQEIQRAVSQLRRERGTKVLLGWGSPFSQNFDPCFIRQKQKNATIFLNFKCNVTLFSLLIKKVWICPKYQHFVPMEFPMGMDFGRGACLHLKGACLCLCVSLRARIDALTHIPSLEGPWSRNFGFPRNFLCFLAAPSSRVNLIFPAELRARECDYKTFPKPKSRYWRMGRFHSRCVCLWLIQWMD